SGVRQDRGDCPWTARGALRVREYVPGATLEPRTSDFAPSCLFFAVEDGGPDGATRCHAATPDPRAPGDPVRAGCGRPQPCLGGRGAASADHPVGELGEVGEALAQHLRTKRAIAFNRNNEVGFELLSAADATH